MASRLPQSMVRGLERSLRFGAKAPLTVVPADPPSPRNNRLTEQDREVLASACFSLAGLLRGYI